MRIAYKFRLYPTKAQRTRLAHTLEQCRLLYNAGLEQRRSAYQRQHVSLSKARQQADLPALKAAYPEFSEVYSQVLQEVLARLDKAFDAFFRRVKLGGKPGAVPRKRTIMLQGGTACHDHEVIGNEPVKAHAQKNVTPKSQSIANGRSTVPRGTNLLENRGFTAGGRSGARHFRASNVASHTLPSSTSTMSTRPQKTDPSGRWLTPFPPCNELKQRSPSVSSSAQTVTESAIGANETAKHRKRVGYPRFRGKGRYDSFTYPQLGFGLKDGRLHLSKIGAVKITLHRAIVGQVKTLTIRRTSTGKWFACFSVELEPQACEPLSTSIGVDVGLSHFATLSTGTHIDNPRFFRADERALAHANRRQAFAHRESRTLVSAFGLIVFEALLIRNMLKQHTLAKAIADAAWAQLVQYTTDKAEKAGGRVVLVDPRHTSQDCSAYGHRVDKSLAERVHRCPQCGLIMDRDENAARNILRLGLQTVGTTPGSPRLKPWEQSRAAVLVPL